jgi:hypothetical protein
MVRRASGLLLPTLPLGHAGEHTTRHVGQLITTLLLIRGLDRGNGVESQILQ